MATKFFYIGKSPNFMYGAPLTCLVWWETIIVWPDKCGHYQMAFFVFCFFVFIGHVIDYLLTCGL